MASVRRGLVRLTVGLMLCVPASHALELEGLIEPSMVIDLSSPVVGVINEISVDKGEAVSKGEIVAKLLSMSEEAQVAFAKAKSERTDQIRYQAFNSRFAARKRDRFEQLAISRSIAELEIDKAHTDALMAQMELVRAENDKWIAHLELARAEALLEEKRVRSPIDGMVVQRYLNPGESVKDKAIVRLAQIDPLKVEVLAQATQRFELEVGMEAEIIPEGDGSTHHFAKIALIDPVADAASGSLGVRLMLPNPEHKILSGLRCRVRFVNRSVDAPTLPKQEGVTLGIQGQ